LASVGFPDVRLADTTAIGWRYVQPGDVRPPPFPHEI